MEGWIKLHRKTLENPVVCKDSDYLAVWMYLLMNATHKEYPAIFAGERITLQPGQLITGRKSISEKFNIHESKVQRILKSFEIEQQIEQQNSNKNRIISILSWSDYQESEQQTEHPVNNKRTTTEQQVNTNKNVKNVKNVENVEEDIKPLSDKSNKYDPEFEIFWDLYPSYRKRDKAKTYKLWEKKVKAIGKPEMNDCVKRYAADKKAIGWDGSYAKMPTTFLNAETFKDYMIGGEGDESGGHDERPAGKFSEYIIE